MSDPQTNPSDDASPRRLRVPHTLVLLFGMIVLALLLTYVLPTGTFERVQNDAGREQVVPGSYRGVEAERLSPLSVFTAIPRGFEAAQDVIFFVFIVGGAIGILRATGALDAMIGWLLARLGNRPMWFVPGTILTFAIGSITIGMAEEYIPFIPIVLALAVGLGFDAVTALGVVCVGYGIGYGAAVFNPLTVLIAQGVAGLQPTSGLGYRLILTVVFLAIGIHHVWRYAIRVKNEPRTSLVAGIEPDPELRPAAYPVLTARHRLILTLSVAAIVLIIYGLSTPSGWHWYVSEMGATFIALSVVLALVSRMGLDKGAIAFCRGAAELTTTALLIGFARSILVVLEDGKIIDTIVNGVARPLESAGPSLAAVGMLVFQTICNFFIPSGSGQAYVTMPIMAPLSDLVGVSGRSSSLRTSLATASRTSSCRPTQYSWACWRWCAFLTTAGCASSCRSSSRSGSPRPWRSQSRSGSGIPRRLDHPVPGARRAEE